MSRKLRPEGPVSRETKSQRLAPPARTDCPPEIRNRLEAYVKLLDKWRRVTNLISEEGFRDVWSRHIADCLQLRSHCPEAQRWLDLGTGAGFPGLVLAIQFAASGQGEVHCIESDGRKCAFLRDVVRELNLPAIIHDRRAETLVASELPPIGAVTARAFGSLDRILELSNVFLANGATAILPRGRTALHELEAVDRGRYTLERIPNVIDSSAFILRIRTRSRGPE